MTKCIVAYTKLDQVYPGYINVSIEDDGTIVITVRGDPKKQDGSYVCGHAADRGKPGRCTPGDDRCNNYCNMAPGKGPMQPHPLSCEQVLCGETVTLRLSAEEYEQVRVDVSRN